MYIRVNKKKYISSSSSSSAAVGKDLVIERRKKKENYIEKKEDDILLWWRYGLLSSFLLYIKNNFNLSIDNVYYAMFHVDDECINVFLTNSFSMSIHFFVYVDDE